MLRPTALLDVTSRLSAAACAGLVLALSSVLPSPPVDEQLVPAVLMRATSTATIVLPGPNPCTGKPAALNAVVETRVTVVETPDDALVEVEAAFENAADEAMPDRLTPVIERFTLLRSTLSADPGTSVRRFPVPVVDRLSGSYLAVELVAAVDADGGVQVSPTETRLVCFAAEDEGVRR